jgi:putative oxidoreductase
MTLSRSRILGIAVLVLRVILAGVFIYAGYVKLRDPWQLFAASIASYEIVPMKVGEIIAKTFPWFEIALGVGLLIGRRLLPTAAVLTALVLVFFNVMLWRAFLQGKEIDCGCFGPGEALTWKTLVRDGSMLAGALMVTWWAFMARRRADRSLA